MLKTKIQKAFAIIALASLAFSNASATQIGTGSVVGSGAFDTAINWDDSFPGTASGSVTDIVIKATVDPILNMSISAAEIDLGTLDAGVASTGSLDIEIGTNAVSGITITARSQSGGLTNTSSGSFQINDLTTDGLAESYTWASNPATGTGTDSSNGSFTASGLTELEVNDDTTEHTVYSSNSTEATDGTDADVVFVVSATAETETPAGEYEDRVTFTVTGNF